MMVKFRLILVIIAVISLNACSKKEASRSLHDVITYSLEECRQLVDENNYWKFGFKSFDEVSRMTLGDSIPVYFVGLNELKELEAGEDPAGLLDEVHEVIYPVLVDGEPRSSIALKKRDGEWGVWNFGRPKFATAIAQVRDEHSASSGRPLRHYFAVEIPSMYLVFIGHYDGDQLMLTHVHDHAAFNLKPGKTEPGSDVFARVADGAKNHTGPLPSL